MFSHIILLLSEFVLFLFFFFSLFSFPCSLELVDLPLVKFDFSCNKVLVIPICFREMKQLQVLLLENNPLQSPPAQVRDGQSCPPRGVYSQERVGNSQQSWALDILLN